MKRVAVKIFSGRDKNALEEKISNWSYNTPGMEITHAIQTESGWLIPSITISVFYSYEVVKA